MFCSCARIVLERWAGVAGAWILNEAIYEMTRAHLQNWEGIEKCLVTHFLQVPSRDSPGIYGKVIGCDEHTDRVFSSLANGTCSNVWMTFPSHLFILPSGTVCVFKKDCLCSYRALQSVLTAGKTEALTTLRLWVKNNEIEAEQKDSQKQQISAW